MNWHRFENELLTKKEALEKVIFNKALDTLTCSEVAFLKSKYETKKTDKQMAEEHKISSKEYTKQRTGIEQKLRDAIKKYFEKHQDEMQRLKDEEHTLSKQKRQVKYFLGRWYYLDTNFNTLNEAETVQMKILYSCLKQLDKQDLEFLAHKYRHKESNRPKSDQVAAAELGMNINKYIYKRTETEAKLRKPIMIFREEFDKELRDATSLLYGK